LFIIYGTSSIYTGTFPSWGFMSSISDSPKNASCKAPINNKEERAAPPQDEKYIVPTLLAGPVAAVRRTRGNKRETKRLVKIDPHYETHTIIV